VEEEEEEEEKEEERRLNRSTNEVTRCTKGESWIFLLFFLRARRESSPSFCGRS